MDDSVVLKSVFFFMCIWAIALLLLWFRRGIGPLWKITATAAFVFYCVFFQNEIAAGLQSIKQNWYVSFLDFVRGLFRTVFTDMFFLWPVALFTVFVKADDIGSEKLLRFMFILSIFLWICFLLYFNFDASIDNFFYETLRDMIPGAR